MQRRATALWAALFVVLAVGAYAMIGAAQEPALVENPDHAIENQSSASIGGLEYTYDAGGGELIYFNESARSTETLEDGSDVDYGNDTYTLSIPNESDPNSFTLRRVLPDDVETTTVNETEYVVVERDGERTLVEPDQYIQDRYGDESSYEFSEGDQIEYDGAPRDIPVVTQDEVTLAWDDPQNETISAEEGDRLDLGGTEYAAHPTDDDRLQLTSDIEAYENRVDLHTSFRERVNGLWAIVIIGGLSAITLIGLAYMPSRY